MSNVRRRVPDAEALEVADYPSNGSKVKFSAPLQESIMHTTMLESFSCSIKLLRSAALVAALICAAVLCPSYAQVLVYDDGNWIVKPTYPRTLAPSREPDTTVPTAKKSGTTASTVVDAYGNFAKLSAYYQDASRAQAARERAMKLAQEALESSGKRYATVSVTARTPVNAPEGDPWGSGPYVVKVREYDVRDGHAGDDLQELQKAVYRREPGLWPAVEPGYFAGAAIAQRLANGKIDSRMMDEADNRKYMEEESKRAAEAERAYRAKLDDQAKVAAEREQDRAEAERKLREATYAGEQRERERKKKESEDREAAIEKARKERERLYNERDRACRSGSGSADCVIADSKLTEWHERAEKLHNTAVCMTDVETGRCAKDGPGCMYCTAVDQMSRNVRLSNFNALQAKARSRLMFAGKSPGGDFEKAVNAKVLAPAMLKKFRLQEFLPRP